MNAKSLQIVRKQLKANYEQAKRRYDERIKSTKSCEGEFVWHFIPRTKKGMNKKWLMTNKGPYRIIKCLNDANFVVQKLPTSGMEMVHIDRLMCFHGTVPKPWKQVLMKEQETASAMSASEDEARASAANVEAMRAKTAAGLPEQAIAKARITRPIRFLRSGDRIDRRLTVSMTVLTVSTVRDFCS